MTYNTYFSGADKTLSVWYNNTPFRMHHSARQPLELELEEHDGFSEKLLKLFVTYKCDGSYFIEVIIYTGQKYLSSTSCIFELGLMEVMSEQWLSLCE